MLITLTHHMLNDILDVLPQQNVVEIEQLDILETMRDVLGQITDEDEVEVDIEFAIEDIDETVEIEMNEADEDDEDEDLDDIEVETVELDDIEIVVVHLETDEDDEIVIGEMLDTGDKLDVLMMEITILTDTLDMLEMVETHIGEMVEMVEMTTIDVVLEFTLENDDAQCLVMPEMVVMLVRMLPVQICLELLDEVFLVELIDQLCSERCSIIAVLYDVEDRDEDDEMLLMTQIIVVREVEMVEMAELEQR